MESSSNKEKELSILDTLQNSINEANTFLQKGNVNTGPFRAWSNRVLFQLKKIYGENHEVIKMMSQNIVSKDMDLINVLAEKSQHLNGYISAVQRAGIEAFARNIDLGNRVFIGHGQSPIWRELKDFLDGRLELPWDEFNREAVAGTTTFERISTMLDSASFAFIIMTAEDQHSDATTHARQNVVHEVGLFQGKLGPRKAIILLEDGCQEFSNIVGLSQIRFPRGRISAVFEDIRRVLEREGVT